MFWAVHFPLLKKRYADLVIQLFSQNSQVVLIPENIAKKNKKCKRKVKSKTQTLTASIHPNNKDILQILLAITYFTSCNKKSKIKDKKHKYKIDFPSLIFLICIGKQDNVHSGLVVLWVFFFLGGT